MFRTSSTTLTGDFYDPTGTAAWCAARGIAGLCKVPSQNTVDYYVRYTGIRNLSLGMYIANLANKFPAIDFRAQSGTPIPQDPGDAKRRTIRLNADYKF